MFVRYQGGKKPFFYCLPLALCILLMYLPSRHRQDNGMNCPAHNQNKKTGVVVVIVIVEVAVAREVVFGDFFEKYYA